MSGQRTFYDKKKRKTAANQNFGKKWSKIGQRSVFRPMTSKFGAGSKKKIFLEHILHFSAFPKILGRLEHLLQS